MGMLVVCHFYRTLSNDNDDSMEVSDSPVTKPAKAKRRSSSNTAGSTSKVSKSQGNSRQLDISGYFKGYSYFCSVYFITNAILL